MNQSSNEEEEDMGEVDIENSENSSASDDQINQNHGILNQNMGGQENPVID